MFLFPNGNNIKGDISDGKGKVADDGGHRCLDTSDQKTARRLTGGIGGVVHGWDAFHFRFGKWEGDHPDVNAAECLKCLGTRLVYFQSMGE